MLITDFILTNVLFIYNTLKNNIYNFIYNNTKHEILFRIVLMFALLILSYDFIAKVIESTNLFQ